MLTSGRMKMSCSLKEEDLDKEDDGNDSEHFPRLLYEAFCRTSSLACVCRNEGNENQNNVQLVIELELEPEHPNLNSQGISSPEFVSVFYSAPSPYNYTLVQISHDDKFRDSCSETRSKNRRSETHTKPSLQDTIYRSASKTRRKGPCRHRQSQLSPLCSQAKDTSLTEPLELKESLESPLQLVSDGLLSLTHNPTRNRPDSLCLCGLFPSASSVAQLENITVLITKFKKPAALFVKYPVASSSESTSISTTFPYSVLRTADSFQQKHCPALTFPTSNSH